MKKLNRKLIPAFAMLLLSAVLMSTASFAWFSSNAKVTASGMKVTATAPAALWISTDGSAWNTSISLTNNPAAAIAPVTTDSTQATVANWNKWNFYSLNQAMPTGEKDGEGKDIVHNVYSDVIANGSVSGQDLTQFPADANDTSKALVLDTTNYYKGTFFLYLEGKDAQTMQVAVKAKVNTASTKIDAELLKCMRIALVAQGATAPVIFEPQSYGTDAWAATADSLTAPLLATITANTAQALYLYIWFEGTDEQCKNANSVNSTEWAIDLAFEQYVAAPSGGGTSGT